MGFIGESVELWNFITLPGYDYGGAGARLRGDGLTETLTAGDDILVTFGARDQLQADSAAVFSLVLAGVSGSASVRVSHGTDPDFAPTTADASTVAGTVTVAAGEVVIPLAAWDVPTYWAGDVLHVVRLEVLSGSVVLDQARLRIWPPGGFRGGWSGAVTPTTAVGPLPAGARTRLQPDVTSWTADPGDIPPGSTTRIIRPTDDDRAQALDDAQTMARADFDAATTATATFDDISASAFNTTILTAVGGGEARRHVGAEFTNDPVGSHAGADVNAQRAYIIRTTYQEPAGVYGVDWQRHPDRVDGETDARMELLAAPTYSWAQRTMTFAAQALSSQSPYVFHLPGSYYLKIDGLPAMPSDAELATWAPLTGAGGVVPMTVPDALTGSPGYVTTVDLPDTDAPVITFELTHDALFSSMPAVPAYDFVADPDFPQLRAGRGVGTLEAGTFTVYDVGTGEREGYDPISYYFHPAPYRVWSPTRTIPLRQLHRDDGRGGTPPAAFSAASRGRSGRAFGYT